MALRWRIRHKLILGLGLVIAIIALLLVGALKGLWSYSNSMDIVESKLVELQQANNLFHIIKSLTNPTTDIRSEAMELAKKLNQARQALDDYEVSLKNSIRDKRALYEGYGELEQVKVLRERLAQLNQALEEERRHPRMMVGQGSQSLLETPSIKTVLENLVRDSEDLNRILYDTLNDVNRRAARDYRVTSIIVFVISIGGIIVLIVLLRGFYQWMFTPLHDLQRGAIRVGQGKFDQHIEVHSGDEMEDLAAAFNSMMNKLNESYSDLSQQVTDRGKQLVRSERLASLGFLAAGVAHEINNPLASIAFCSEALQDRLKYVLSPLAAAAGSLISDEDAATVTRYLTMIQQEAFRCKDITQRLLEFSRGGEGQREPVDLTETIQSVLEMVQHLQSARGKEIVYEPTGSMIAIANAQEMKSVILNLVVNALESMDEGGSLTISQCLYNDTAELCFQDTGCGMAPEVLENIFEPFFTRSRTGKGTGLGLSISHRVIHQHGGEIEAMSDGMNQGSTFLVRIPTNGTAENYQSDPKPGYDILDARYEGFDRRAA